MNTKQMIAKREKELKKELQGMNKNKAMALKLDKRLKELQLTIKNAQKELDKIYADKRVIQLNEIIHNSCEEVQEIYNKLNINPLKHVKLTLPPNLR